ncbi:MAG: DUF1616 domain-containing protein [Candidatus Altiarchaeota archaeon]
MDFLTIVKGTAVILSLIVVPGYALTLALFPKKNEIDTIERMGLVFLLGLTPMILLYFLNKNFGIAITTSSTALSVAVVTLTGLIIYGRKR